MHLCGRVQGVSTAGVRLGGRENTAPRWEESKEEIRITTVVTYDGSQHARHLVPGIVPRAHDLI